MVFVKEKDKAQEDTTISVLLNKKVKAGDIGIEIEVEGARLPQEPPNPWDYHRDGSLRGQENAEYVLSKPINFDEVNEALDNLWAEFKKNKSRLDASNRTSVHVHLNVLPFYMNRLTNLTALWFIFEDVLTHWCGDYRVGNLFCLRAKDAPAVVRSLRRFIESDGVTRIPENNHYAALNGHAIHKFGSLEFRPLRGTDDVGVIKTWVGVLRRLYAKSEEWKDPRELIETFSLEGTEEFFYGCLGEYAEVIRKGVTLTDDQIRDSLFEGMRYAQDLCYARDWTNFNPVEIEIDPFGRKKGKKAVARIDLTDARVEVEFDDDDDEDDTLPPNVAPQDWAEIVRPRRIPFPRNARRDPFEPFRIGIPE